MSLQKDCEQITTKFVAIQDKYRELENAYRTFCRKKHELDGLLQPPDPDSDSGTGDGTPPKPYPSEEDKAAIVKAVAEAPTEDLARVLELSHLNLGSLNDENRMVFQADTILQEAAKRLRNGAYKEAGNG